jgi:tubulin--tyrosine ligase
VDGDE